MTTQEHRILIVDDEPELVELFTEMVRDFGYNVDSCLSAEEALARFPQNSYHAVLCDIDLKGMNGIQLLESLVAKEVDVPFIIITGNTSPQIILRALRAGAVDFLTKPVIVEEVEEVLARVKEIGKRKIRIAEFAATLSSEKAPGKEELATFRSDLKMIRLIRVKNSKAERL